MSIGRTEIFSVRPSIYNRRGNRYVVKYDMDEDRVPSSRMNWVQRTIIEYMTVSCYGI